MNHSFFQSEAIPDSYLRHAQSGNPRKTDAAGVNFPPGFASDEHNTSYRSNVFLDTQGLYSTEPLDPHHRADSRGSLSSGNRGAYFEQRNAQSNFPSRNPSKNIWSTDSQPVYNPTIPQRNARYEETSRAEASLLPSNLLENQTLSTPATDAHPFSYARNDYRSLSKLENQPRYSSNRTGENFGRNGESFGNSAGTRYGGASDESNRMFYQNPRYGGRRAGGAYLNDGNGSIGVDNMYTANHEFQPHQYVDRRRDTSPNLPGRNIGAVFASDGLSSAGARHNTQGWSNFGNPMPENMRFLNANGSQFDMNQRGITGNHSAAPAATQPRISGRMGKCTNPELLSLYNPKSFNTSPANARYFVIKSFTEDDVHKSLKYHIWTSTEMGNRRLDKAFKENSTRGPVYLFFSVNGSGHFCGAAQMLTPLDYSTNSTVWAQNKWKGIFSLKWIFVKDIPNAHLRHIIVPLNNNKPVTNSRDTQELNEEAGQDMLKMFLEYRHKASILDDFEFYEKKISEPPNNTSEHPGRDPALAAASMARSNSLSSYHSN